MGSTVNVNMLTVVHAGSGGLAMSFPDVCKTPVPPGGPVPIPYPNVAQSSDTDKGSTTVKIDGNPIMLKGSCFKTSTGDEPGSVKGVISSQNKGKALPANWSFDVKVDGDNVFRLTDLMKTNAGSPANSVCPAEVQAALVGDPEGKSPECTQAKNKKREGEQKKTAWSKSGIIIEHRSPICAVAKDLKVVIYFRQTKDECSPWIRARHQPKPHDASHATTIVSRPGIKDHAPSVKAWLEAQVKALPNDRRWQHDFHASIAVQNEIYSLKAMDYIGIVGEPKGNNAQMQAMIRPMVATNSRYRRQGKWMTGDYDLFQVLGYGDDCQVIEQESEGFGRLQTEINKRLGWEAIQHGPQAQWSSSQEADKSNYNDFDMNTEVKTALKERQYGRQLQTIKGRDKMKVIDSPLTVVAGHGGVICLDDENDVAASLICKGC